MMNRDNTILLVGWFFYPKIGGVETLMLNQARYLLNLGYKVYVLTSINPGLKEEEQIYGINIIRRNFMKTMEEYALDKLEVELSDILDKVDPDIVHFHNGSYPAATWDRSIGVRKNLVFFRMLKERGIVAIDHAHNAQLSDPEITKPLRELPWDYVICVSRFVKERWEELGTGAKRLMVVYDGIDLSLYENVRPKKKLEDLKENDNQIIFFPARMEKQKNFLLLAKAAKCLIDRGLTNFKIVTIFDEHTVNEREKKERREIREILNDYGLSDKVVFIPAINPFEMPSYYASCDIMCVPSVNETFGLVYLEAMALGKVVIASNTGGPKEYIKDEENGFLVDPEDPKGLAFVLERLLRDKNLLTRIGIMAKRTANNYSVNKTMESIEKIYRDIS